MLDSPFFAKKTLYLAGLGGLGITYPTPCDYIVSNRMRMSRGKNSGCSGKNYHLSKPYKCEEYWECPKCYWGK